MSRINLIDRRRNPRGTPLLWPNLTMPAMSLTSFIAPAGRAGGSCVNVKMGGRTRAALPSDVTWDASEAACQTDPSFGAHPETSPLETEFNCFGGFQTM